MEDEPVRWNRNLHYHRRILDVVPAGARTALDVGTGDGLLAIELRELVPQVTGIDPDAQVLESARRQQSDVTWVEGDVMTYPLTPASFDVVASVLTIHHGLLGHIVDTATGQSGSPMLITPTAVVGTHTQDLQAVYPGENLGVRITAGLKSTINGIIF